MNFKIKVIFVKWFFVQLSRRFRNRNFDAPLGLNFLNNSILVAICISISNFGSEHLLPFVGSIATRYVVMVGLKSYS